MPQLLPRHAPRHLFLLTINLTSLDRCVDHLKVRESTSNIKQVLGPLESLLPGLLGQGVGPVGSLSSRPMGPRAGGLRSVWKILEMYVPFSLPRPRIRIARGGSRPQHLGMDQAALENALQVLIQ